MTGSAAADGLVEVSIADVGRCFSDTAGLGKLSDTEDGRALVGGGPIEGVDVPLILEASVVGEEDKVPSVVTVSDIVAVFDASNVDAIVLIESVLDGSGADVKDMETSGVCAVAVVVATSVAVISGVDAVVSGSGVAVVSGVAVGLDDSDADVEDMMASEEVERNEEYVGDAGEDGRGRLIETGRSIVGLGLVGSSITSEMTPASNILALTRSNSGFRVTFGMWTWGRSFLFVSSSLDLLMGFFIT